MRAIWRKSALAGLPVCVMAMLLVAGPSLAQGFSGRGMPAALSQAGRGWMSVGRLEVAAVGANPQSFCTVSLIAEDRALTAAHCVIDRDSGRGLPPAAMQVRLGFQNGRAEATRGVTTVTLPAGVAAAVRADAAEGGAGLRLVPLDLAVLSLDSPVRLPQIAPLTPARSVTVEGRLLSVVSYARGRSEMAGLQEDCQLIVIRDDGALVLLCEVDSGASGAPVLVIEPEGPRVVAVVSARAELRDAEGRVVPVALAAPLTGASGRGLLLAAADRPAGPAPHGSGGVRVRRLMADDTGGGSGARFVRP